MERLKLRYSDANKALQTLKEILALPYSVIIRDATIQRFEYTFEAFWKFIKEYLKQREGIIANAPKACFRELLSTGLTQEKDTVMLLEMTDRRNDTSHTYKEAVAQKIYEAAKDYSLLMEKTLSLFKKVL